MKIVFYGHFGRHNFGNESTFQAALFHLRRMLPEAKVLCICTGPEKVAEVYQVEAVPISEVVLPGWVSNRPATRWLRTCLIGIPSEIYRWVKGFFAIQGTDALIVPGTGLLTDAYSLSGWGPYSLFKWSVTAKLSRRKLVFLSVGAGPLYSTLGRYFVRSALKRADFCSFRDEASVQYLKTIGCLVSTDKIYPDLAFSLPEIVPQEGGRGEGRRTIVGLGIIEYPGRYSVEGLSRSVYNAYLEKLAAFAGGILARDCDVRILIGDASDATVAAKFRAMLKERYPGYAEERVIDEPVRCVEDLLAQIKTTDVVVATRFHNVLLSVLLRRPAIAISFHHKCKALMSQLGLDEYCKDIETLTAAELMDTFCALQRNAATVKARLQDQVEKSRRELEEQYRIVAADILGASVSNRSSEWTA
ncbi:MAG TPA: polysaccharide pyruvyl transferase family protein [Bryobacteraceae bacterium]|jgi:polysaccharide pyruvyl transferase WcaK-like protein